MAELLAATGYRIPTLRRNQEVSGKILAITPQEILIDIGAKSEGIVFGRELASVRDVAKTLAVGDTIEAAVVYPENDAGQVVLSLRKLSGEKRWFELEAKRKENEMVEVTAVEVNRGGIICDFAGLRGFLPASQLSTTTRDLIGKTLEVKVIEVDRTTNRLIFSHQRPSEKNLKDVAKLLKKVEIGGKYQGVVSAVLPFGLFVEIKVKESKGSKEPFDKTQGEPKEPKVEKTSGTSRLDGLVHISEIAWEKIEDPTKLYKVGDDVEVALIGKDEKIGRLNLSLKQLAADPFAAISSTYAKDQQIEGQVARVTSWGIFVTLAGGVEGLVPISKVPPNESWDVGKKVECTIESIDTAARRISLIPVVREKPILYR